MTNAHNFQNQSLIVSRADKFEKMAINEKEEKHFPCGNPTAKFDVFKKTFF